MNRHITTGLSVKELENLAKQIDNWAEMMNKASKKIVEDLANYGLEKMQEIYGVEIIEMIEENMDII